MRRLIGLFLSLVLITVLFTSCGKEDSSVNDYKLLNELSAKISGYSLTEVTETDGERMIANYKTEYSGDGYKVNYNFEVLKKVDLLNPEDGYKRNIIGEATVKEGEETVYSGEKIERLPGKLTMNFDENNFENAKFEDGKFTATVTDSKSFLGNETNISGMTAEVNYSDSSILELVLNYTVEGTVVTATYTFR